MQPEDVIRDGLGADALGLTEDAFTALLSRVLTDAATRTPDKAAQTYYALAYLYGMEARFISRQLSSGSGDEGSFSYGDVATRLARAQADQVAAQAKYDALTGTAKPKRPRGSGSVPMVVEP